MTAKRARSAGPPRAIVVRDPIPPPPRSRRRPIVIDRQTLLEAQADALDEVAHPPAPANPWSGAR